jgi:hypothetical protein
MEFLYPGFLYALTALAIPVIVHLFNFRRFKKIPFTNVRFLRDIKVQTRSQNRLRHLLVLLMRLLALVFLVLAFAQPYIPQTDNSDKEKRRAVSVFLDNSFSMEGEGEAGPLLEVGKNRAIDLAMAYSPTDRFQLITHDFLGANQRFVSRAEFIENVDKVEVSSASRPIEEVSERQRDLLLRAEDDPVKEAFIISDFQKSRFSTENFKPDSALSYGLIHLTRNSPANLYIDSVWFPTPVRRAGQTENIRIRIVNTGADYLEDVPMSLYLNGEKKAIGSFSVEGESKVDTSLSFLHETPSLKGVKIEIEDAPINYDDTYFLGYNVHERLYVLSVHDRQEGADHLASVYRVDSTYAFSSSSIGNLDYASIGQNDLVILNELASFPGGLRREAVEFVKGGGSLWIIPGEEIDRESYNLLLDELEAGTYGNMINSDTKVTSINAESRLYRDVFESVPRNIDLPTTGAYYPIRSSLRTPEEKLLPLPGGNSFLSVYESGSGKIYLLASPLGAETNNFSRHALFVTSALRIGELSRSTEVLDLKIGEESSFSLSAVSPEGDEVFKLVDRERNFEVIPGYRRVEGRLMVFPGPELDLSGHYELMKGDTTLARVGMNYERKESDPDSYARDELEAILGSSNVFLYAGESNALTKEIERRSQGTELWKICLILALAFLLLEALILRFGNRTLA